MPCIMSRGWGGAGSEAATQSKARKDRQCLCHESQWAGDGGEQWGLSLLLCPHRSAAHLKVVGQALVREDVDKEEPLWLQPGCDVLQERLRSSRPCTLTELNLINLYRARCSSNCSLSAPEVWCRASVQLP